MMKIDRIFERGCMKMTRPRLGIQQALLNALVFAFFSSSICVMAKSPASSVLPFNGFECSKKIEERLIKENTLQPWIFQGPSYVFQKRMD